MDKEKKKEKKRKEKKRKKLLEREISINNKTNENKK